MKWLGVGWDEYWALPHEVLEEVFLMMKREQDELQAATRRTG